MRALDLQTTGMEFATEMVVKATLAELRIAEVPTTLRPTAARGRRTCARWRDGWRHLRFLLLFSPRWLFIYPGLALSVVGRGICSPCWPSECGSPGQGRLAEDTLAAGGP